MSGVECMKVLGLGHWATAREIKSAYRRLAQKLHPDKNPGDDWARQRFVEVAAAYRVLMRAALAAEQGRRVGACLNCMAFGEIVLGPDRIGRCPRCALCGPRRCLPLPTIVVAKCIGSIALIALTIYLLMKALSTERLDYAGAAFAAGLASLLTLAHTCLTIIYCIDPRQRNRARSASEGFRP